MGVDVLVGVMVGVEVGYGAGVDVSEGAGEDIIVALGVGVIVGVVVGSDGWCVTSCSVGAGVCVGGMDLSSFGAPPPTQLDLILSGS